MRLSAGSMSAGDSGSEIFAPSRWEVALVYSDGPEMEEFVTALRAAGRTVRQQLECPL
jgi:hypothetical protein